MQEKKLKNLKKESNPKTQKKGRDMSDAFSEWRRDIATRFLSAILHFSFNNFIFLPSQLNTIPLQQTPRTAKLFYCGRILLN